MQRVRRQTMGPRYLPAASAVVLVLVLAGCGILPMPPSPLPTVSAPPLLVRPSLQTGTACAVTPFETIPPNDVVGWDQPTWQRASDGIWAHPYLGDDIYSARSGFLATDPGVKILWWVLDGGDEPLVITVASYPTGSFSARYSFDKPGPNRRDRPTGFPIPPAGCYEIRVDLGARTGSVIDQVLP